MKKICVKVCKTQAFSQWTFVPHCTYVLFTNTQMSLESLLLCMKIINYKTNRFKGKSHLARRELISRNIKGRATLMCFHSLSPNKNSPHFTSITTQKQLKFKKHSFYHYQFIYLFNIISLFVFVFPANVLV